MVLFGPLPVTPVVATRLNTLLIHSSYNLEKTNYLVQGFTHGFDIGYRGPDINRNANNLISTKNYFTQTHNFIKKELGLRRVVGPFESPPFTPFSVSPIGLIPKSTPGKFRMIQHLSFPSGLSVNDGINAEDASVNYSSIQDAIDTITAIGKNCYAAKCDIAQAFSLIPVLPSQFKLLGFKWCEKYYYMVTLPMGLKSSCKIFECFSTALHYIVTKKFGRHACVHLLDDFLFLSHDQQSCQQIQTYFQSIATFLGIPLAEDKNIKPVRQIQYLGIYLDCEKQIASLPTEKLTKCRNYIELFLQKEKVTLRELQQLIGLLNFACSVIAPGRAFLRRLIDLTIGLTNPNSRVNMSHDAKQDLTLWLTFFRSF